MALAVAFEPRRPHPGPGAQPPPVGLARPSALTASLPAGQIVHTMPSVVAPAGRRTFWIGLAGGGPGS